MSVICIKFIDGPHKDQYGYFTNSTADARVKEGVAEYYDPSNKKPDKSSTIPEIKDYLGKEGIEYDSKLKKAELLELINGTEE